MLDLKYECLTVYSLAAQQNDYRLFTDIKLHYLENQEDEISNLRNLTVKLECEDDRFESETWEISQIRPGQFVKLQDRVLPLPHNFLFNLSDEVRLNFIFTVLDQEESQNPLLTKNERITILPANFWGGESRQPELLAAFVKPNGVYVDSLVKQVTEVLEANGHGRSADGYQSNSRENPYFMAAALWEILQSQKIAYVQPPPSFANDGQLIRLAANISNNRMAACLDLSVLFASCLELMGLNAVIALSKDHAFVGVWLIDRSFPVLTNDDPMDLRKRVDSKDLLFFETTMITSSNHVDFKQACVRARDLIEEEKESEFVYAIDIFQARARKIRPIATEEERQEEVPPENEPIIKLPSAPSLPPVRSEEKVIEETAETRIDKWQRKLLDLTKNNSLLNFTDRRTAIKIFCPDIGKMEDQLAESETLSFISAEASKMNEKRSEESFRLRTGNDSHKESALELLERNMLVANMPQKKLESSSINLFRKAKNNLEEGGANTLFIALGMLKWRENSRDKRSFKAPLILIPIEFTRKSAGARIKLKQLFDENPIFNLTLIEFLYVEYEIDLNHLRDELPKDESGIDVERVWQDVRDAVSEQEGFEVIEECVIASFSFAKYLMWKDLKDRIDDLKENLFVAHLVDRPQETYYQNSSFIDQNQVDQKIDPSEVFTPLNCDSSQLVAVEASGRPQDFVLEGPPGTGKSETIANMIAHNLAKRRKVLFVAEKIAALQVVYRRLKKIQLDHLCLELHSNKANKQMVIDQLRRATETNENRNNGNWLGKVSQLRGRRDQLNHFVAELHGISEFGISPRFALTRIALYKEKHSLTLDWKNTIEDAPIRGEATLSNLIKTALQIRLAYENISSLDTVPFKNIVATSWSHAWQNEVETKISNYLNAAQEVINTAQAFSKNFEITLEDPSFDDLDRLTNISELTNQAVNHPLGYAIGSSSRERLQRLKNLTEAKGNLDRLLGSIGHAVTVQKLKQSPTDEWLDQYKNSESIVWKRTLTKFKINYKAKKLGYEKFKKLDVLSELAEAKNIYQKITVWTDEFKTDGIWSGWDTSHEHLRDKLELGEQVQQCITQAISLVDDTLSLLSAIKSKLIDSRDFLEASKLYTSKEHFNRAYKVLMESIKDLSASGISIPKDKKISATILENKAILASPNKLRPWVEWVEARNHAEGMKLSSICDSLKARTILPEDVEEQLITAFCKWLAPILVDASDQLRTFRPNEYENLIGEFRNLDKEVAQTTGQYIATMIAQTTPNIDSPEYSEHFGTLSREFQKRTRHKPIRALFKDMGERLLDLCPCLMMSPLSVAQFLPSDFNAFDIVIFDEASQITTWDSVGAIARGKNVIVVGDPKQMPPTNFFNSSIEADNPDEEDLESILDQALAARLPHRRLMGHYRSRHETLIAFSNSKYYENSLITYPSSDTKKSAVSLRRVDGIYSRGKDRNNPIEAQAVVKELIRRLNHPELRKLSIGIVTLNTEQQRTIEDLIDTARRKDSDLEEFFKSESTDDYDPVFVKNLESVQGDERDVIIFSLGYGPTEPASRVMSMNFGPLNRTGGERRLNVAITRATTEVIVFSSFDSNMINLSRTSATAVEHLKHYLEFAERGPIALSEQSSADHGVDQFDSDFEQVVAGALRDKGWNVQTQIGVSRFRIDLGVLHPELPGRYLAGIECDGATYHSSPSARDRDRIRQAVLEDLGWQIIRLWSTDYYYDSETAINRIDQRLRFILEEQSQSDKTLVKMVSSYKNTEHELGDQNQEESRGKYQDTSSLENEEIYSSDKYYEPHHKEVLSDLAKQILSEQPCITIKALALDIAQRHGLSRTSKKQIDHLKRIIDKWAGIWKRQGHEPVYWLSPSDIQEIISWRGLEPFGYERDWVEIAYPEALGLAVEAIEKQPDNPVDYICSVFQLKRRHPKTLEQFGLWVQAAKDLARTDFSSTD